MDGTITRCALLVFDTLMPLAIGYVAQKKGLVHEKGTRFVIDFNVRVMFTVLALISFWKLTITPSILWVFVVGLVISFVPFTVMMAATRRMKSPRRRGALVTSGMLGNTGTLGGLVSFIIMGPAAYAYVQAVAVLQNTLLIVFNFPVAQKFHDMANPGRGGLPRKRSFAELFLTWNQIALVGMAAGAALSLARVPQPSWLGDLFTPFIHVSTWISFLPVGLLMDFGRARSSLATTLGLAPLRFLLMPCVTLAACWLFGVSDPTIMWTLVIISVCPTAINAVMTCALYSLDTDLAVAAFITTTTIFVFAACPVLFLFLG